MDSTEQREPDRQNPDEYALVLSGGDVGSTAQLSTCGTYRYSLSRDWNSGPRVVWVMLNPSTADAFVDDPTIRRCIGFSKAWGFGSLTVVNLFALRSTDPKALLTHPDPCGPHNGRHIAKAFQTADLAVAAWGAHKLARSHVDIAHQAQTSGTPLVCLGTTKDGSPRHPLYVRADQGRAPWPPHTADGPVFGSAGDGLRWQHRSDRPTWHPDNCEGRCCWRKVAVHTDREGTASSS